MLRRLPLLLCLSLACAPALAAQQPPRVEVGTAAHPFTLQNAGTVRINGDVTTHRAPDEQAMAAAADRIRYGQDERLTVATEELAKWTIVLAAVAVIQAVLFMFQLWFTRASLADTKEAADAALVNAQTTAAVERAYIAVTIRSAGFSIRDGRNGWNLEVLLQNSGKTPAILRLFRAYTTLEIPQELMDVPGADRELPAGIVVPAGGEYLYRMRELMLGEQVTVLKNLNQRLFVVGVVEYDDVMQRRHRTGFSWGSYTADGELSMQLAPSRLIFMT